jgi:hypothetical protein
MQLDCVFSLLVSCSILTRMEHRLRGKVAREPHYALRYLMHSGLTRIKKT